MFVIVLHHKVISSQKLKFSKLSEISLKIYLVYCYILTINLWCVFSKILQFMTFWANLVPKFEVLRIHWNLVQGTQSVSGRNKCMCGSSCYRNKCMLWIQVTVWDPFFWLVILMIQTSFVLVTLVRLSVSEPEHWVNWSHWAGINFPFLKGKRIQYFSVPA